MSEKKASLFTSAVTLFVLAIVSFLHVLDMLANEPLQLVQHWWGWLPIVFLASGSATFWLALREKK